MAKIIPEKMVEVWTARAILNTFGSSTRLWVPAQGYDQMAGPGQSKRFLLELKTSDWVSQPVQMTRFPQPTVAPSRPRPVEIDVGQLLEYHESLASEVLYVLPQPAHYSHPSGLMELEAEHVRSSFPKWAYVICSSRLLGLIDPKTNGDLVTLQRRYRPKRGNVIPADRGSKGRYQRGRIARVVCTDPGHSTTVRNWKRQPVGVGVRTARFGIFLALLQLCPFDPPLIVRSANLLPPSFSITGIPDGLSPLDVETGPGAPGRAEPPDGSAAAELRRSPGRLLAVEVRV